MVKFEEEQNILDVHMEYEILGFFRLGFNPKNICEPKLWILWQKTKYHRTYDLLR
jgi:hypothetical protein